MFCYGNSILELTIARAIIGFGVLVVSCQLLRLLLFGIIKALACTLWIMSFKWWFRCYRCYKPLYFIVDEMMRSAFYTCTVVFSYFSYHFNSYPENESTVEEQIYFALKRFTQVSCSEDCTSCWHFGWNCIGYTRLMGW